MTTQTNEQQAVELAEKHGAYVAIKAESGKPTLVEINPRELTAMLADHAQQVREARTAELVANAVVMPTIKTHWGTETPDEWYDPKEVREAIVALQARVETAAKDAMFAAKLAAKGNRRAFEAEARVAELERDSERFKFAFNLSPDWTFAVCQWNQEDKEWLPISSVTGRADIDAARYQWIREQHEGSNALSCCVFAPNDTQKCLVPVGSVPGELDEFIDAAMNKGGGV